jgi:hypothetical protein
MGLSLIGTASLDGNGNVWTSARKFRRKETSSWKAPRPPTEGFRDPASGTRPPSTTSNRQCPTPATPNRIQVRNPAEQTRRLAATNIHLLDSSESRRGVARPLLTRGRIGRDRAQARFIRLESSKNERRQARTTLARLSAPSRSSQRGSTRPLHWRLLPVGRAPLESRCRSERNRDATRNILVSFPRP